MAVHSQDIPEFGGLKLVAGHPVLDFVNSVKYRGETDPGDILTGYPSLLEWSEIAGVIDQDTAIALSQVALADQTAAHRAFEEIIGIREAFRRVLPSDQISLDEKRASAEIIDDLLAQLAHYRKLDAETLSQTITLPTKHPRDLALFFARSIDDLLNRPPSKRIGCCEGDDCDWVYMDGGRGKHRRWCDSRTCGNTARVRKYRGTRTETETISSQLPRV